MTNTEETAVKKLEEALDIEIRRALLQHAKSLPPMQDLAKPFQRQQILGHVILAQDSTSKLPDGTPIKPNKKYVVDLGHPPINHYLELVRIYVKYGWDGVTEYNRVVKQKYMEGVKAHEEKTKKDLPANIEDSPEFNEANKQAIADEQTQKEEL